MKIASRLGRILLRPPLRLWLIAVIASAVQVSWADGPQDNIPTRVRRIPKEGIVLQKDKRDQMEHELRILSTAIQALRQKIDERINELLPDVIIFERAVSDALQYQEFFDPKEIPVGVELILEGRKRADQLARGKAPWTEERGLVVPGYVSKIDGSVQPYGLVVPASYSHHSAAKYRLDLWFHGRGETLSELNFLQQRRKQIGTFAPADTIVLHPYGRYSNAFKFAGEIDVLEALDSVKRRHFRGHARILAKVLTERFVIDRGWTESLAIEFGKQILRGNVEHWFGF